MSFRAIAWAWEQTTGSAGRKAVLMAVAQFADEAGTCWPSQGYIARYTEQSERTVREHLAHLEADRFIARQGRTNPDGKATSDLITINFQRQISPPANFAGGEKPQEPPAKTAANTVIGTYQKKKEDAGASHKPVSFDFETGTFHDLDGYRIGRLQAAFPAINVEGEVLRAALWLVANPANRKSNYLRFITSWMQRAQDRAPRVNPSRPSHATDRPRTAADRRDDWTSEMFGARRAERDKPADEPPGLFGDQPPSGSGGD